MVPTSGRPWPQGPGHMQIARVEVTAELSKGREDLVTERAAACTCRYAGRSGRRIGNPFVAQHSSLATAIRATGPRSYGSVRPGPAVLLDGVRVTALGDRIGGILPWWSRMGDEGGTA